MNRVVLVLLLALPWGAPTKVIAQDEKAPDAKTRNAKTEPDLPPVHFTLKAFDEIGLSADDFATKLKDFSKEIGLEVADEKTDKSYEVTVTIGFDDSDDDNDGVPDEQDQDDDSDGADDDKEGVQKVNLDKGIPALMAKCEDAKQDYGLYFIITNQSKTAQVRFSTKVDALDPKSEAQQETIGTIVGVLVGELFDFADAKKGDGNKGDGNAAKN